MGNRLVVLSLDWIREKDPRMSLGHASIIASIATHSTTTFKAIRHAVNDPKFSEENLILEILTSLDECTALAIGVYIWNNHTVCSIIRNLRHRGFTGRIILGGPQISYTGIGLEKHYPEADVFIRGDAEIALTKVIECSAPTTIDGVHWAGDKDQKTVSKVDLTCLTSPILSGVLPVNRFMRWETQRGCIYRCSFCQHREAGARPRNRSFDLDRLVAEIDIMVEQGAEDIAVLDPIFNDNPDALQILNRFVEKGYKGRLSLQSRFELLDKPFLKACAKLNTVLEFGLQTVKQNEMRAVSRMNNLQSVDAGISDLHHHGIPFEVSLIYGLPNQTIESFKESIAWCQNRQVPTIRAFPLMLLRGTALDLQRDRWGLVESQDTIPVVIESNSFTRNEWALMQEMASSLL